MQIQGGSGYLREVAGEHLYRDPRAEGVDVTKDITVRLDGDSVVLAQEGSEARGRKTGNRLLLEGNQGAYRIEFRLYLMGDAYIYQKDVWEGGEIVQSQMSYLQRINIRGN